MKKIKSNKKPKKEEDSDFEIKDINEIEDKPTKRKKPQPKKSQANKNKKKEETQSVSENDYTEKNELIFQGISERDPSVSQLNLDEIEYPYWLKPEFLVDAEGRSYLTDPNYDPSTIHIPEKEFKKLSAVFQQYWEIKSKNFDKVIFFRMGMPLMCFYDDAILLGKICDMRVGFWGARPFANVWPKYHQFCMQKLISLGYKTVTVEQMETHVGGKTDPNCILRREIVEILTKGTITDENFFENSFDQKFLLCLMQKNEKFGLTLVDCMTQTFYFDEVNSLEDFKTIIYRVKPVEIVSVKGYMDLSLMTFIKAASNSVFSQISHHMPTIEDIFNEFEQFFKDKRDPPAIFLELYKGFQRKRKTHTQIISEESIENHYLIQSLYLCFVYLKTTLMADSVFLYGNFSFFDFEALKSHKLYLDSTALRNLEIFDVNTESKLLSLNSLFHHIDKTKTAYGKRLFKKWLETPLRNVNEINDRLDAIEDLNKNASIADYFHSRISKLPDFERCLGRIYNSTHKQKLAYSSFDSFASNRLNEFFKLLDDFSKVTEIIENFDEYKGKFKSARLKKLVTIKTKEKDDKGFFPDIKLLRKEIDEMIDFSEDNIVIPRAGTHEKYDELSMNIKSVQEKLNDILQQLKKKLKCSELAYNHNKMRRYEVEVPVDLAESMPGDYFLTSKRKGILRYQNGLIENYAQELIDHEKTLNEILAPFFLDVFKKFYDKQSSWLKIISCLGELDCLVGLSKNMIEMSPYSCRPIFKANHEVFELEQVFHPCLVDLVENFVPNDIIFQKDVHAMLITGPNMGGKSTILRQACVAIIMAQIGSYVPAKSFVLSTFDRIFCRIGANDKILEGKSTFFMEMEESLSIVKEATQDSFVIFDELGRGTSTYDGVALAFSVLKYIVEKIKSKTMFSTHYHLLVDEFKFYNTIKRYFMDFKYNEEKEEMEFLYKFIEGEACKSFGINVAKIVGVPTKVLDIAKEKAHALNSELANIRGVALMNEEFNKCLTLLHQN